MKLQNINYNYAEIDESYQEDLNLLQIDNCDYRNEPLLAQNSFIYVYGYLMKKI